jgi:hypothetical protein
VNFVLATDQKEVRDMGAGLHREPHAVNQNFRTVVASHDIHYYSHTVV